MKTERRTCPVWRNWLATLGWALVGKVVCTAPCESDGRTFASTAFARVNLCSPAFSPCVFCFSGRPAHPVGRSFESDQARAAGQLANALRRSLFCPFARLLRIYWRHSARWFRTNWYDTIRPRPKGSCSANLFVNSTSTTSSCEGNFSFLREGHAPLTLCLTVTSLRLSFLRAGSMPRAWHARNRAHQARIHPSAQPMARSQASHPRILVVALSCTAVAQAVI